MYDKNILKPLILEAIATSKSMAEASSKVDINFKTFRKYAKEFDCWIPNPSGKGKTKISGIKIPIEEILNGNNPQYHTYKLGKRLVSENIKPHMCEICGLTTWNDKPIPLEVDHIDGNPKNHLFSNLRLLCPNCHAQTDTYCGKNKKSLRK